jgi:hypothetical protein
MTQVDSPAQEGISRIGRSEELLESPNYTEDIIIYLGRTDSAKSFILDIMEFPFESGILEQA